MNRVMINKNLLDDFSRVLDEIQFEIRLELNINGDCNNEKLYKLLEQLTDAWEYVYNPIGIDIAKSMRRLYSHYITAKKTGDLDRAETYLQCYLVLKNG